MARVRAQRALSRSTIAQDRQERLDKAADTISRSWRIYRAKKIVAQQKIVMTPQIMARRAREQKLAEQERARLIKRTEHAARIIQLFYLDKFHPLWREKRAARRRNQALYTGREMFRQLRRLNTRRILTQRGFYGRPWKRNTQTPNSNPVGNTMPVAGAA